MKVLAYIIILVLAVFGFSEFLHTVKLKIIFPKAQINSCLIVKLKDETALKQTEYACEQFSWYGKRFADSLQFNCDLLSDDIRLQCKAIAERYGIDI